MNVPALDILSAKKRTNVRLLLLATCLRMTARLSPSLAAGVLAKLFLRTRRQPTPPRESQWLESAVRTDIPSGDHRLAVWSWGEGPTALLVHGWEGRGSQLAAFVEPLLSMGFRVVTFDAPGHGQSSGRSSSLIDMADAIRDVAQWAGSVEAIVAHSAGASVTTIALDQGLQAKALVYLAPATDPGSFLGTVTAMLGLPPEIALVAQMRIEKRFDVYWSDLVGTALAPRMELPLTVFHDRNDREVPWTNGRDLVRPWPGATLRTVAGLGHRRILRDPEVIDSSIEWLGQSEEERNHQPHSAAN
ncbi:MAG: alpha/beta hydrolase [Deltaproteobacteria bacterium]|nr:alpha/beta hydrolase [Deltaproteobacteria bacterium]